MPGRVPVDVEVADAAVARRQHELHRGVALLHIGVERGAQEDLHIDEVPITITTSYYKFDDH